MARSSTPSAAPGWVVRVRAEGLGLGSVVRVRARARALRRTRGRRAQRRGAERVPCITAQQPAHAPRTRAAVPRHVGTEEALLARNLIGQVGRRDVGVRRAKLGRHLAEEIAQLANTADVAEQRGVGAQHGLRVQVGHGARVGVAHRGRPGLAEHLAPLLARVGMQCEARLEVDEPARLARRVRVDVLVVVVLLARLRGR
eukprot:scaffold132403_cov48-Phaeocystis_antarctica.AAC.1